METSIIIKSKENKDNPFYCREEPLEVLKGLITTYPITKYKSLSSRINISAISFDTNSEKKVIYGLEISDVINFKDDPQIMAENSWKDFNKNIQCDNLNAIRSNIMTDFIKNYLLKVTSAKDSTVENNFREQIVINYLDTRKTLPQEQREKNVADIIEYGQAAVNSNFDISKLEQLTATIITSYPKKFYVKSCRV